MHAIVIFKNLSNVIISSLHAVQVAYWQRALHTYTIQLTLNWDFWVAEYRYYDELSYLLS